ncbi:TPA: hypothetical protein ACPZPH_003243 [Yersinia enterocolitica]
MSNYALIKNSIVENVVVWDGKGNLFPDFTAINVDNVLYGIGWIYSDENFTDPNEPKPPTNAELYQEELSKLSEVYLSDVEDLSDSFAKAGLIDGVTEQTKKTAIYNEYSARKVQHTTDITNLKLKYGM